MSETASEARHQEHLKKLAFTELANRPDRQAKAIAHHYVAHARVAQHVLELLNHPATPARDQAVNMLISQIKTNHAQDLGIELEWSKPDPHE